MAREAISVTLAAENLVWLKGRAAAAGIRSVSQLLDQLVTAARRTGHEPQQKSVAGTVDVDPADPMLLEADRAVRFMFAQSLQRPLVAREQVAEYGHVTPRDPSRKQPRKRRLSRS